MKKIFGISLIVALLVSCSNDSKNYNFHEQYEYSDDSLSCSYYNKDVSKSFSEFMKNPYASSRSLEDDEETASGEYSEEELFAELWNDLPDEEKEKVYENLDDVQIEMDLGLEVPLDSDIARSIQVDEKSEFDFLLQYHALIARLKDIAGNQVIHGSIIDPDLNFDISAADALESAVKSEDWQTLMLLLQTLGRQDELKSIKNEWLELSSLWELQNSSESRGSSSSTGIGYETALYNNLGKELKDGDILLTNYASKAYVIAGDWSHGGIFSKELYDRFGRVDGTHCVYTAQPDAEGSKVGALYEDMKPDRYGKACLEPIYAYTKMKKFTVIRPNKYTAEKAKKAVDTARTVFYDDEAEYLLPIWEAAFRKPNTALGWIFTPIYSGISYISGLDTSHDMSSTNTYCTKVVYTAWKEAGVNVDSNTFAGNLVSPDDIYNSSISRYVTITIKILWWKFTKRITVYNATTDRIISRYR